jgi:fumarate hydratase subunit alpha
MLSGAEAAEKIGGLLCADSGIPEYTVRLGSGISIPGDIRNAISEGFDELVREIVPPMLGHITDPFTLERGYKGKDVPIVHFDWLGGVNYAEVICSPKGLGSGQWAGLQVFSFPSLEIIERYVMECVKRDGGQHCPPVIIGVGIGGTFDLAAIMAKEALLRPLGTINPDPKLERMEERLLEAVNQTGIGPMGTGGDTTALGVHVKYACGHGFTPVAVCFNCWINRRTGARIFEDGRVEYSA